MKQADTAKDSLTAAASNFYTVTPHDTNEIGTYKPRYLYVGGTGDLAIVGDDGVEVTWTITAESVGVQWCRPRIIKATGTTVTADIIACY